MFLLATAHAEHLLTASGRSGGEAALWLGGWLVVLALIAAAVVYVARRRKSRSDGRR